MKFPNAAKSLLGALAATSISTVALAQLVQDGQSGLSITPPPGYVAQVDRTSGFTARIVVAKQADKDTVCFVDFQGGLSGPLAQLTQEQLNEMSRKLDQRDGMKGQFESSGPVEHADHDGVVGAVLTGNFTAAPNYSSLLVIYYTPKGRSTVSCFTPPPAFEGNRADFLKVATSITFPH